jgi:hypothetical protein
MEMEKERGYEDEKSMIVSRGGRCWFCYDRLSELVSLLTKISNGIYKPSPIKSHVMTESLFFSVDFT